MGSKKRPMGKTGNTYAVRQKRVKEQEETQQEHKRLKIKNVYLSTYCITRINVYTVI